VYHELQDQQPVELQDGTPSSKNCGTTSSADVKLSYSTMVMYTHGNNKTKNKEGRA
jgi:hypothetical protein